MAATEGGHFVRAERHAGHALEGRLVGKHPHTVQHDENRVAMGKLKARGKRVAGTRRFGM
eukprot:scaffold995_cov358-Pavlova_lutheri.AAC.21